MSLAIRPIEQNDAESCGKIGYEAHKTISSAHGYPSEQPSEEGGVGRTLMDAALTQARKQNHDHIRLVQSPSHIRSFVLYTKSGFTLREPLFLMQGQPLKTGNNHASNRSTHPVLDDNDISMCNELCKSVYGFSRDME